jgi:hypothetical protein
VYLWTLLGEVYRRVLRSAAEMRVRPREDGAAVPGVAGQVEHVPFIEMQTAPTPATGITLRQFEALAISLKGASPSVLHPNAVSKPQVQPIASSLIPRENQSLPNAATSKKMVKPAQLKIEMFNFVCQISICSLQSLLQKRRAIQFDDPLLQG